MLDSTMRKIIDPPLNMAGKVLASFGIGANQVTIFGLMLGLISATIIALGETYIALIPLLASRIADGLDGAVARATEKTDFGGYLDIAADFLFYGAIPLAFIFMDPVQNGLSGGVLLAAFYFNGTSFLGFAILAEKHGMETSAQGSKSLFFSNGLLEGTETIAFFVLICALPQYFAVLAWVFGVLCYATAVLRILSAYRIFSTKTEIK